MSGRESGRHDSRVVATSQILRLSFTDMRVNELIERIMGPPEHEQAISLIVLRQLSRLHRGVQDYDYADPKTVYVLLINVMRRCR